MTPNGIPQPRKTRALAYVELLLRRYKATISLVSVVGGVTGVLVALNSLNLNRTKLELDKANQEKGEASARAKQEIEQVRLQADREADKKKQEFEQQRAQLEQQRAQLQAAFEREKIDFDKERAELADKIEELKERATLVQTLDVVSRYAADLADGTCTVTERNGDKDVEREVQIREAAASKGQIVRYHCNRHAIASVTQLMQGVVATRPTKSRAESTQSATSGPSQPGTGGGTAMAFVAQYIVPALYAKCYSKNPAEAAAALALTSSAIYDLAPGAKYPDSEFEKHSRIESQSFQRVDFNGTSKLKLERFNLSKTDFSSCRFPQGLTLKDATIEGTDFSSAEIVDCDLAGVKGRGKFSDARVKGFTIGKGDFFEGSLSRLQLLDSGQVKGCNIFSDLTDTKWIAKGDITLEDCTLRGKVTGATFDGVTFRQGTFCPSGLEKAQLLNCKFDHITAWSESAWLIWPDAKACKFSKCDLSFCDFRSVSDMGQKAVDVFFDGCTMDWAIVQESPQFRNFAESKDNEGDASRFRLNADMILLAVSKKSREMDEAGKKVPVEYWELSGWYAKNASGAYRYNSYTAGSKSLTDAFTALKARHKSIARIAGVDPENAKALADFFHSLKIELTPP